MSTTLDRIRLVLAMATVTIMLTGVSAAYATAPVKEVLSIHYGWEVDKTTKGNVCTVASGDECQPGKKSGEPGGFENLGDVAVGSAEGEEDIWVDDAPNQRIQEITPAGRFVLTIGDDVNATTGGNICTQAEIEIAHVRCQAGREGGGEGEFDEPASVAVDRATHDLYVLDASNYRIQEFTEAGQFVAMFGKEVNETKDDTATEEEKDVCAAGDVCKAGVQVAAGSTEPGAFTFAQSAGSQLVFGGPEHLLYVDDTRRIQELGPEGRFKRQIALETGNVECAVEECSMRSLAIDETGDLFAVYAGIGEDPRYPHTVHELGPSGEQIVEFTLSPHHPAVEHFSIAGVAVDDSGMLAVSEIEVLNRSGEYFGSLIDADSGELITEFSVPNENEGGLAFNAQDELYLAISARDFEVVGYRPMNVAELDTSSGSCVPAAEGRESDATFACTLNGTINPEAAADTEAWFEWGLTAALGETTPVQSVCTTACGSVPVSVKTGVEGVPPNATLFNRLAAFDEAVKAPETPLISHPTGSVSTELIAPRLVGTPSAEFVKRSSAVLFAELNPENAPTRYWFQYAPVTVCERLEGCTAESTTQMEESSAYARIGTTAEATGLQPGSTYRYRLIAENENTTRTKKAVTRGEGEQEGTFTTFPPIVVGATTGSPSSVGETTAVIAGSVESDGQPVSYAFELGIANGVDTQYGIVYSGSIGSGSTAVEESRTLSGLQPGTTYSYRISVRYGDGMSSGWLATSSPTSFTTQGLPVVLVSPSSPPLLGVPSIAFPRTAKTTVKITKRTNKKTTKRQKKVKQRKHKASKNKK